MPGTLMQPDADLADEAEMIKAIVLAAQTDRKARRWLFNRLDGLASLLAQVAERLRAAAGTPGRARGRSRTRNRAEGTARGRKPARTHVTRFPGGVGLCGP
jgi:hypothetical protein